MPPSPTGYLHIGGARTALFNYLFAKANGGEFLLRIEDTDQTRSTEDAKQAILTSLEWLGIIPNGEIVYQSSRAARHAEVAAELVAAGKAYYCFTPQAEIATMRDEARAKSEHFIFHSPWRDADAGDFPKGQKPVIRLKSPMDDKTIVKDLLQGDVSVQNSHLDDMVLLRSNGTPTYMLAVVVDDHDMEITHIIRGDDHLSNAHRQQLIYQAMGWAVPQMAHIPLIHGPDGAKLSKRHGALGADAYKELGYLPDALNNYLLRLGWSHGDDEIITRTEAIEWFGIDGLGKSPSRIDFDKMKHMNATYLRAMENDALLVIIQNGFAYELSERSSQNIKQAMDSIKQRAELVTDLYGLAAMYSVDKPLEITEEAELIIKESDKDLIKQISDTITNIPQDEFNKENIQVRLKELAKANDLKLGALMKFARAFISGRTASPSVFEMIAILGKGESNARLSHEQ